MRLPHFFIDRPIFAAVLSIIILIIGAIAQTTLPVAEYPEIAPPTVNIAATYPGRLGADHLRDRRHADRARGQRRRRHALHRVAVDRRWAALDQRCLQARHQHRSGAGAGAEPRLGGRAAAARGRAPSRHRRAQGIARPDDGRAHDLAGRKPRPAVHLQLRDALHPRRAAASRWRGQHQHFRCPRLFDARLARPSQGCQRRPHGDRGRCGVAGGQSAGCGRLDQPAAGHLARGVRAVGADPRPAHLARSIRRHRGQGRRRRIGGAGARYRARRARLAGLHGQRLSQQQDRHCPGHLPATRVERVGDRQGDPRRDGPAGQRLPAWRGLLGGLQSDRLHSVVRRRRGADAARGGPASRHRRHSVLADVAGRDHPDRRHPSIAHRHLCGYGGDGDLV